MRRGEGNLHAHSARQGEHHGNGSGSSHGADYSEGMKIGAHFAPEVEGVDMTNVMDALRSGVTGKIIDVTDEDDGEHVEIFIE